MNITSVIEKWACKDSNRIAVYYQNNVYTYQRIHERSSRFANYLKKIDVCKGDRVAIILPNSIEFILSYYATHKVGAITISINNLLTHRELDSILRNAKPKIIITLSDYLQKIPIAFKKTNIIITDSRTTHYPNIHDLINQNTTEHQTSSMESNEIASLLYTSGTTADPKGVMLSHGNLLSNVKAASTFYQLKTGDKALLFLPLYHCFGQNAIMNSVFFGGGSLVIQKPNLNTIRLSVNQNKITHFFAIPSTYTLYLNDEGIENDFKSIRYFFSAAATLPIDTEKKWKERFKQPIYQGYGLTETSPFATYNHVNRYKLGSIGEPIENVQVKIITPSGEPIKNGTVGEILIKGPNVMQGYWNNKKATQKKIKNGWFHTGDLGQMDEDGYLYYKGRIDDRLNISGRPVFPREIEEVLMQHPAVDNAVILGIPDNIKGNKIIGYIEINEKLDNVSEHELLEFCRDKLAKFKIPEQLRFIDAIPKNPSGKILIRELRNREKNLEIK